MTELRLLDPNGYLVPGTITTVSDEATASEIRHHLTTVVAPEHAAQWADFGYHPGDYRIA